MTLLRWAIRTAARASLDTLATALDHAASALHRAAGEPSAVEEMRRERDSLLDEVERCHERRREAEQAISDLYDYATDAADLDSLDGTIHMPTRIRESLDRLRARGDRMRDAARVANRERRSLAAALDRTASLACSRAGIRRPALDTEEVARVAINAVAAREAAARTTSHMWQLQAESGCSSEEYGRIRAALGMTTSDELPCEAAERVVKERDEARAECERLSGVARMFSDLAAGDTDQGGAG